MSRLIKANYPGKKRLTETEAKNDLKFGPMPHWFKPWASEAVLISDADARYALVHVHGDPVEYEVRTFITEEKLRWALDSLYNAHTCGAECVGIYYVTPDVPLRMYAVIETDEGDES